MAALSYRKEVIAWSQNIPTLLALFGVLIARNAKPVYEFLCYVRKEPRTPDIPRPPLVEWLEWYDIDLSPRGAMEQIGKALWEAEEFKEAGANLVRQLQELAVSYNADPDLDRLYEALNLLLLAPLLVSDAEMLDEGLSLLDEWLKQSPEEVVCDDCGQPLLEHTVLRHFIEIRFASILLFQETIETLIEKAANRDLEALKNLVRLDRSAVHIPAIAQSLHNAPREIGRSMQEAISDGAISPWPSEIYLPTVKVALASFYSEVLHAFGVTIGPAKIRQLFDIIARSEDGTPADFNLPAGDAALRKAISRGRPHWRSYVKPLPDYMQKFVRKQVNAQKTDRTRKSRRKAG